MANVTQIPSASILLKIVVPAVLLIVVNEKSIKIGMSMPKNKYLNCEEQTVIRFYYCLGRIAVSNMRKSHSFHYCLHHFIPVLCRSSVTFLSSRVSDPGNQTEIGTHFLRIFETSDVDNHGHYLNRR